MKKNKLSPGTEIEVVATKDMTVSQYEDMVEKLRAKGWKIQGYQKGFRK